MLQIGSLLGRLQSLGVSRAVIGRTETAIHVYVRRKDVQWLRDFTRWRGQPVVVAAMSAAQWRSHRQSEPA